MRVTVRHGRRYRARVHLGFLEQVASDEQIAEKLRAAGFEAVTVTGSGRDRWAMGTYTGADATVELDDHLSDVKEI